MHKKTYNLSHKLESQILIDILETGNEANILGYLVQFMRIEPLSEESRKM